MAAGTQNEHLLNFCQFFISEKICDQASILAASHLPAAVSIARVCHGISKFGILPDFLVKLLGTLAFRCPLLNGSNPSGFSFSKLGYKMKPDGISVNETNDSWIERMRGYISLYIAILLCDNFEPGLSWTLLVSILNLDTPHPWIPFLLVSILDVGSISFFRLFQGYYLKLILLVKEQLIPTLKSTSIAFSPKSSLPRLEIMVDEILLNPTSVGLAL